MATQTARTAWFPGPNGRAARYRPVQLWQVPVFFAGLVALAAVVVARLLWHENDAGRVARDLAAARALLARRDCPVERVQAYLAAALDRPATAGAAHFLLGSAYILLAYQGEPGADDAWQKARAELEQAEALGVPEPDRPRLRYRLGKAWYHTQGDPAQVVAYLSDTVATADDPVEGYGLLTGAYLRLPEPDVAAALAANEKQLELPTLDESVLAPARLLRGELLLRSQRPDEAREVLKFIKPPAAPDLVALARSLRARSYQQEGQWAVAAPLWKEALEDRSVSRSDAAEAGYNFGICCQNLGKRADAVAAWEKVQAEAGGDLAQAATVRLAELRLQAPSPQDGLSDLERLVRNVSAAADWHNSLVDLARVREVFERGCVIYHTVGRYDLAMRLAELYEPLAPPGVAQSLFAQSAEAAARAKQEQTGRQAAESARVLFREAGRKNEAALAAATSPADRAERLWRAADCYLRASDFPAGAAMLERWIKTGQQPERLGEAWFRLAEARRALHRDAEASDAYNEAVGRPGPFACRARYQLALLEIARGEWDRAEEDLELNRKVLRTEPDADALERTLFELGDLMCKRHNYRLAAERLHEALHLYPASPRVQHGRFLLAECYRNLALQEGQNLRLSERMTPATEEHYQKQYRDWLEKAALAYEELTRTLGGRLAAGPLPADEESLYRQASFSAAECRFNRGEYQAAVALYMPLVARYHHRIEGLQARAGIIQCCFAQGQPDEARKALDGIRALLKEMDESAFKNAPGGWTKADWEKWLATASKR